MNKFALPAFFFLFVAGTAMAAGMSNTHRYAWSENAGWINFNPSGGGVSVTDDGLTGYAWNENYGWINLDPDGSGVVNNGSGTLSGSAWGEHTGWIDFDGVTIDADGFFRGYASGSLLGRISFHCDNDDSCGSSDFKVQTDWRVGGAPASSSSSSSSSSASSQTGTSNGGGSGGGGGGGGRRGSPGRPAAPAAPSSSSNGTSTPSSFMTRVCERVAKRFQVDPTLLERVNVRLLKRFGFSCDGA